MRDIIYSSVKSSINASINFGLSKLSGFRQPRRAGTLLSILTAVLGVLPAQAAKMSFEQASADYAAGKYAQSMQEFQLLEISYPTNVNVHYYEALCCQALNHLDKAKAHYEFVAKTDNGRLKALSLAALSQLARVHDTQIAYGTTNQSIPANATNSPSQGETKIRKVIEFYADW